MAELKQTSELRKRDERGGVDTPSHHGLALLQGEGVAKPTPAQVMKATADMAEASGLKRFIITWKIDPKNGINIFETFAIGAGGKKMGAALYRSTSPVRKTSEGAIIVPKDAVGIDPKNPPMDIFECGERFDYRTPDGKPLRLGFPFQKPDNYQGFAPLTAQKLEECYKCLEIPPEEDKPVPDPDPQPFTIPPREERKETSETHDYTPRVKHITYSNDPYRDLMVPMLLDPNYLPGQPEISARGRNPNATNFQTPGDFLRAAADVPLSFISGTIQGRPFVAMPFHSQTRDSAARAQVEKVGGNILPDGTLRVHNQWPVTLFTEGQLNPFGTSNAEWDDAARMGTVGIGATFKDGKVVPLEGSVYGINEIYSTGFNAPSATFSQVGVDSNFEERNTQTWRSPSAPVELKGITNYGLAQIVDQHGLNWRIHQAADRVDQALASNNKADAQEAAQKAVGLMNYRLTLVGASNYRIIADVKATPTFDQTKYEGLNPAEQVAYLRNQFVAGLGSKGITLGINPETYLPAESPLKSIPKADMVAKLESYFEEMAKKDPATFERFYRQKEHMGKANPHDLKDAAQRKNAVTEFVASMPFVKGYSENTVLAGLDAFVSTRDQNNPGDLSKNNFNAIERGEKRVDYLADTKDAQKAAMSLFGNEAALTATILKAAGKNEHLARVIALYDRRLYDLPAESGDHSMHLMRRTEQIKALGYSDAAMNTTFAEGYGQGILRGNIGDVQRDLAASAGNAQITAQRGRHLLDMITAGSDGKIKAFPKGSTMTALLYAISTDEETQNALEAEIRKMHGTDTAKAEMDIRMFHAGMQNARNEVFKHRTTVNELEGVTFDRYMDAIAAQQATRGGIEGKPLASSTKTTMELKPDTNRAEQLSAHVADGKNVVLAKALFAQQAMHGTYAKNKEIVELAASPGNSVAVVKAMLKELDLGKLTGVDRIRKALEKVKAGANDLALADPKTLTEEQAAAILKTIADSDKGTGNDVKFVITAIAKDTAATKAVAAALHGKDKQFVSTLTTQMAPAGTEAFTTTMNTVKDAVAITPADVRKPTYSIHTAHTVQAVVPDAAKLAAAMAGANVVGDTAITLDQKAAGLVTTYFAAPATAETAWTQLKNRDAAYFNRLALQSLVEHPELLGAASAGMGAGKVAKFFSFTADARLSNILDAMRNAKDAAAFTAAGQQLYAFVADPANAAATAKLLNTITNTGAGRNAMLASLTTALEASLADERAIPVAGVDRNGRDTLNQLYAVLWQNPSNQVALAKLGMTHIGALPAVADHYSIPGILYVGPKPKKPEQPTPEPNPKVPEVTPGQCEAIGPTACPIPGTPTVTPPGTVTIVTKPQPPVVQDPGTGVVNCPECGVTPGPGTPLPPKPPGAPAVRPVTGR